MLFILVLFILDVGGRIGRIFLNVLVLVLPVRRRVDIMIVLWTAGSTLGEGARGSSRTIFPLITST